MGPVVDGCGPAHGTSGQKVYQGMRVRVAIVSTMREPGQALASWIRYHLGVGFDRIYLFFDDPEDADQEIARPFPQVTVIPQDALLRAKYPLLGNFPRLAKEVTGFYYARQLLHMELATRMALMDGCQWLLHLDDDELFFTPTMAIARVFERAQQTTVQQVAFLNHEAVPMAWDIGDRFVDVRYFKRNPYQVSADQLPEIANFWMARRGGYFSGYVSGKPAVRVQPGLTARGAHRFARMGGDIPTEPSADAWILHYAHCGYEGFRRKYAKLGHFPDALPDGARYTTEFHRLCRAAQVSGSEAAFRELYASQVMLESAEDLARQLTSGLVIDLPQPATFLKGLPLA